MKLFFKLQLINLAFILMILSQSSHAQIFEIKNGSKNYDAKIDVECEQDQCGGKAKITLYQKGTKYEVQSFDSDELTMYLDKNFKPSVNVIQLYNEQSPLIFDDFNFDGAEDLAIRNGNYGSYGGPVYDIYVFNKTKKKFVFSDELSNLTQENLGMFQIDHDKKRIITFNKSGCCYHITSEYIVVPNKGLVLVHDFEEDATSVQDEKVKVTERNLVNGKWKEKTKYYPIDQYYKE